MAGTTTKQAIPYPTGTDVPFVHLDIQNLAAAVDGRLYTVCTEATPSDTRPTGAARFSGAIVFCTDTKAWGAWDGSAWRMQDSVWQTYTPGWSATTAAPSVGNGSLVGKYFRLGRRLRIKLELTFGSTTSGGQGVWTFSAPAGSGFPGEENGLAKAFMPGFASVAGFSYVDTSGIIRAYLPVDIAVSSLAPVQNTDTGGGTGTGVPTRPGAFTYQNGANLFMDIDAETT